MGTATFAQREDDATVLTLELTGTSSGNSHPSHIHFNTAAEGGDIAVSLSPVDGATGMSETIITELNDGKMINYEELIGFDGYINVHNSTDDLGTLIAQGDIGSNELTGEMTAYDLIEKDQAGTMGTVTFMERKDGTTLSKIELMNTLAGDSHPGHIHENSAAQGGGILFTFNQVNGNTGLSMMNIRMLDDGTAITYTDILSLNGYVNIHKSVNDLATLVAQGDIGSKLN